MYCSKCGYQLTGNEKFCPKCGKETGNFPVSEASVNIKRKKRPALALFSLLTMSIVIVIGSIFIYREWKMTVTHLLPFTENGKWGYIDQKTGEMEIETQYEDVTAFSGTTEALCKKNGQWIWINKLGEEKEDFGDYDDVELYPYDMIVVEQDGEYGIVDKNGNTIAPIEYEWITVDNIGFTGRLTSYNCYDEEKCYTLLFNRSDRLYEDYDIASVWGDYELTVYVEKNGKTGVGDGEGNILVPCMFDSIYTFTLDNGDYSTETNRYFAGVLKDAAGEYQVEACYTGEGEECDIPEVFLTRDVLMGSDIYSTSDLFPIEENGLVGYADVNGNIVISPQFIGGYGFYDSDSTLVGYRHSLMLIDKTGKVLYELESGWETDGRGLWDNHMNDKGWMLIFDETWDAQTVVDSSGETIINDPNIFTWDNQYVFTQNEEGQLDMYEVKSGIKEISCICDGIEEIPGTDWIYFYTETDQGERTVEIYYNKESHEKVEL